MTIRDPAATRRGSWSRTIAVNLFRRRCSWPNIPSTKSITGTSDSVRDRAGRVHRPVLDARSGGHSAISTYICDTAVVDGDSVAAAPIRETTIPGQIAAPLRLDDGRLLAFVVDRGRPGTMTLWCSSDDGETWPTSDRLVVYTHDERAAITQGREHVDFKQYWEDMGKWSFGHPALRLLADGRLLLAWYAGSPDCMSLHWARVRVAERSTSMKDWIVTDADRELFDRELDSFVPPTIFDAHAHWYRADHFAADATPALVQSGPAVAGSDAFDAAIGQLIPNRRTEGLFFPFPHAGLDVDAANEFLHQELRKRPGSRGQMLITPDSGSRIHPRLRAPVRLRGPEMLPRLFVASAHVRIARLTSICPNRKSASLMKRACRSRCTWSALGPWPTWPISSGSASTASVIRTCG